MTISPSVQLVSTVPFAEPERIVIPTEPISFNRTNPLIVGGAQVDVTITQAMLDNAEEIEFYTLAWEFVKESNFDNFHVSDLEEIGRINAYSEQYANDLQPRTQ